MIGHPVKVRELIEEIDRGEVVVLPANLDSQVMDLWGYQNGVRIAFSRPGKPTDNAFVESFNGTFRAECLDAHWFTTLTETRQIVETWRREYNESRPHRALGERTPNEFAHEIALAAISWSYKQPKTCLEVGTKKPVRSSDVDSLSEAGTKTRAGHSRTKKMPLPCPRG